MFFVQDSSCECLHFKRSCSYLFCMALTWCLLHVQGFDKYGVGARTSVPTTHLQKALGYKVSPPSSLSLPCQMMQSHFWDTSANHVSRCALSSWLSAVRCLPGCQLSTVSLVVSCALSSWLSAQQCLPDCQLCTVFLVVSCALSSWSSAVRCLPGRQLCAVFLFVSCALSSCSSGVRCLPVRQLCAVFLVVS